MRKILAALAIAAALAAVLHATREPVGQSGAQLSPTLAHVQEPSPTPALTAPDPASVVACNARVRADEHARANDLIRRGVERKVAYELAKTEAWHKATACGTDPTEPRRRIVLGADGTYRDAEPSK